MTQSYQETSYKLPNSFEEMGVLISKNAKTGLSINVDSCKPTPWCAAHCYRRFRNAKLIDRMGWDSTPNTGPITWRMQRNRYELNETFIKDHAKAGSLDELAAGIAAKVGPGPLRGNGTGDLFPELCELYAQLAFHGVKMYLFSRIPEMIRLLGEMLLTLSANSFWCPTIIGSTDPSTTCQQRAELIDALEDFYAATRNTMKSCLAFATGISNPNVPLNSRIKVIFGYHSNHTKTVVDHPLACPATNGEDIKCLECRRCIDLI